MGGVIGKSIATQIELGHAHSWLPSNVCGRAKSKVGCFAVAFGKQGQTYRYFVTKVSP